jgi:two-component system CheB/CheR fusion protein
MSNDGQVTGSAGTDGGRGDAPGIRKPRALVVDDNRDTVESTRILLELLGYEVEVAFDGPSALQAARATRPDVVLLDIAIPRMDGFQVARKLRQEFGPRVVLVAITGFTDEKHVAQSQAAGFDCHLLKPFSVEELEQFLTLKERQRSGGHGP